MNAGQSRSGTDATWATTRRGFLAGSAALVLGNRLFPRDAFALQDDGEFALDASLPPLRALAASRGITFGAALSWEGMLRHRRKARSVAAREFNQLTPEYELMWIVCHPEKNAYSFSQANTLYRFARNHGMRLRGAHLMWYQDIPDWLRSDATSRVRAEAIARRHIGRVIRNFRGGLHEWDVVNEAVSDDAPDLRVGQDFWLDVIGADYLPFSFRVAREADANAVLLYNDYGIEGFNQKSDTVYQLMRDLLAGGAPVDGIGFQAHLDLASGPPSRAEMRENFARFAALGLRIFITELDVNLKDASGTYADVLRQQAAVYRDVVIAALDQGPALGGITTWGIDDPTSWLVRPELGLGGVAPLLFDDNINPKPAYAAVARALRG